MPALLLLSAGQTSSTPIPPGSLHPRSNPAGQHRQVPGLTRRTLGGVGALGLPIRDGGGADEGEEAGGDVLGSAAQGLMGLSDGSNSAGEGGEAADGDGQEEQLAAGNRPRPRKRSRQAQQGAGPDEDPDDLFLTAGLRCMKRMRAEGFNEASPWANTLLSHYLKVSELSFDQRLTE